MGFCPPVAYYWHMAWHRPYRVGCGTPHLGGYPAGSFQKGSSWLDRTSWCGCVRADTRSNEGDVQGTEGRGIRCDTSSRSRRNKAAYIKATTLVAVRAGET